MVGHSKFILTASLVIGFALLTQFSAHADNKKKAEGDDFTEKLKDRFPDEAKRGKKSIFRSVKESDVINSEEKETKVSAKPSAEEEEVEKPKLMLADLFKSKSKATEEDKKSEEKEKSDSEAAEEEAEEEEAPKVMLADLFKKKSKKEDDEEETIEADVDADDKKKPEPVIAETESEEKAEKPKFMLADLFKNKSKKDDKEREEKALKAATANGMDDEAVETEVEKTTKPLIAAKPSDTEAKLEDLKEEMTTKRVSTPKFFGLKKPKPVEPLIAETTPAKPEEKEMPVEEVADKPEEKEKEKSKGWGSNLFGKKSTKPTKPAGPVIPADSLTNKPAPKVEFSKVDTSRNLGEGGDFTSWDDVPYKRKSTVDRMMSKLNVTPVAPRSGPRLPGSSLPGGPSKPAAKSQ